MFIADLHFSEFAPRFRSSERNWIKTQAGYIRQLQTAWETAGHPPLFIAGDIFHVWNASPYIITNVIDWFREMQPYTIAGNHDTPFHSTERLDHSAYYTLAEAGVIRHMRSGQTVETGSLVITCWPFSRTESVGPPPVAANSLQKQVALIHDYIWAKDCGYTGAPDDKRYATWLNKIKGYDYAFFGDNHKAFFVSGSPGKPAVVNCGCFMRRREDEKDYTPSLWFLKSDGTITRKLLDVSKDSILMNTQQTAALAEVPAAIKEKLNNFIESVNNMNRERTSFKKVVERFIQEQRHDLTPDTVNILYAVLEEAKDIKNLEPES